jgi:hypothetical protein
VIKVTHLKCTPGSSIVTWCAFVESRVMGALRLVLVLLKISFVPEMKGKK